MNEVTDARAVLFYDGACGLCSRVVQFTLRHEAEPRLLRFATLQGARGDDLRARHPRIGAIDSFVLLVGDVAAGSERALVRSDAAIELLSRCGLSGRFCAALARTFPSFVRDAVYDLVAAHRRTLVNATSCAMPCAGERHRFLD
jgi:predicted DCC family thiol-disulfide oxidoreductase YuxK